MKISDVIFRYTLPGNRHKDGLCRVRTFVNSKLQVIALITDLDNFSSISITNSIEIICNSLIKRINIPTHTIFIEHYESTPFGSHTFDLVTIKERAETIWESMSFDAVAKLLECEVGELNNITINNEALLNEIQMARLAIDSHLDLPKQAASDYLLRQIEIENKMISKADLARLIDTEPLERTLLTQLKKDLSLLAEVYAQPFDSYICIADFPLNLGFVDFVLLTGASRMDVFLIEIKGADFNIQNQSKSYPKFHANIDKAIGQIRNRLGYIHRNRETFRTDVHAIRAQILSGTSSFSNTLIGSRRTDLVDKNKDINIHNIVISGRTKDDLKESYKRQDFETNFTLLIKLESWVTFFKKAQATLKQRPPGFVSYINCRCFTPKSLYFCIFRLV